MTFYQKRTRRLFGRTNTMLSSRKGGKVVEGSSKVERRKSRALMLFGVSLLVPHPLLRPGNRRTTDGLEGCCWLGGCAVVADSKVKCTAALSLSFHNTSIGGWPPQSVRARAHRESVPGKRPTWVGGCRKDEWDEVDSGAVHIWFCSSIYNTATTTKLSGSDINVCCFSMLSSPVLPLVVWSLAASFGNHF